METRQETLTNWLRDAQAMKQARTENLERQLDRYEEYPQLHAKLDEHLRESQSQLAQLERHMDRLGADKSTFKSGVSKAASKLQGWTTASAKDEVVKNTMANEAFAEFEAASFEALAVAARECGENELATTCTQMRDYERDLASWLHNELPSVTQTYLQRHTQPNA